MAPSTAINRLFDYSLERKAMPKTVPTETKENDQEQDVEAIKREVLGDWDILYKSGFVPWRIRCDGYKGEHPSDMTCHTTLVPTAENMIRHAAPEHGIGCFRIRFRITDDEKKKSKVWKDLKEAGFVLEEFWCPHCRTEIGLVPREIIFHLQPHAGANRVNLDPQVLCMKIVPFDKRIEDHSDLNSDLRMI